MTASTNGTAKTETGDAWTALRAPFPSEAIGKKPQPLKKNAEKGKCDECGKWHGLPAIHIDFVGHAYVTERLNSIDPGWELVPSARDESGEPLMIEHDGQLRCWAKLTVLGKTHEEVGEGDNPKETWSDVLKRCAMRFGVAVDLWKQSEENAPAVEPEDTYGTCPGCGTGLVVKRTKRDGSPFAKCSKGNYRDKSTCQWVDWDFDFDASTGPSRPAQRAASNGHTPAASQSSSDPNEGRSIGSASTAHAQADGVNSTPRAGRESGNAATAPPPSSGEIAPSSVAAEAARLFDAYNGKEKWDIVSRFGWAKGRGVTPWLRGLTAESVVSVRDALSQLVEPEMAGVVSDAPPPSDDDVPF